jgi:N-acyl-D-amino-acid deacylase
MSRSGGSISTPSAKKFCRSSTVTRRDAITLLATPSLRAAPPPWDVLIRGGTIYDGTGAPGIRADLALKGDRIAAIGDLPVASARAIVDAEGCAVTPGFINVLSWAADELIHDGRGLSDLKQGVTLEIFGEGTSLGPLNPTMRRERLRAQPRGKRHPIPWVTNAGALAWLARRGVALNIASFVGAATIRIHALGYANRPPTRAELARMQDLVHREMRLGALGVGSALIYAPGAYAQTAELAALAASAAPFGGVYISHLRSEGDRLLEALDELLEISRIAKIPAEIYHLKAAGRDNWPKLDAALARIEEARASGLRVAANMYTYTAASTGLDAAMPPWVQEGGFNAWRRRLRDPAIRPRVAAEMRALQSTWENLLRAAGPDQTLLLGFANPTLRPYIGKTLAEVALLRNSTPEDAAIDLVIEDASRVSVAYFLMSEQNVRRQVALPWMAFGSDARAIAAEGDQLQSATHPRTYGNFARLLGKYVRDEQVLPLEAAIHQLTALPADRFSLAGRGRLVPGAFADVVVFDPQSIRDTATFERPHSYAEGVHHVFVNGRHTLKNGEFTGLAAGRFVRGPGYRPTP